MNSRIKPRKPVSLCPVYIKPTSVDRSEARCAITAARRQMFSDLYYKILESKKPSASKPLKVDKLALSEAQREKRKRKEDLRHECLEMINYCHNYQLDAKTKRQAIKQIYDAKKPAATTNAARSTRTNVDTPKRTKKKPKTEPGTTPNKKPSVSDKVLRTLFGPKSFIVGHSTIRVDTSEYNTEKKKTVLEKLLERLENMEIEVKSSNNKLFRKNNATDLRREFVQQLTK